MPRSPIRCPPTTRRVPHRTPAGRTGQLQVCPVGNRRDGCGGDWRDRADPGVHVARDGPAAESAVRVSPAAHRLGPVGVGWARRSASGRVAVAVGPAEIVAARRSASAASGVRAGSVPIEVVPRWASEVAAGRWRASASWSAWIAPARRWASGVAAARWVGADLSMGVVSETAHWRQSPSPRLPHRELPPLRRNGRVDHSRPPWEPLRRSLTNIKRRKHEKRRRDLPLRSNPPPFSCFCGAALF